jgi:hypothetical protein
MNFNSEINLIKATLKDKWLDYYEDNQFWIGEVSFWGNTPGTAPGRRPESRFILAIVCVLEPQLPKNIAFLSSLNVDPNHLLKALGLDFDPKVELQKRTEERAKIQAIETIPLLPESDTEYLDRIRQENIT